MALTYAIGFDYIESTHAISYAWLDKSTSGGSRLCVTCWRVLNLSCFARGRILVTERSHFTSMCRECKRSRAVRNRLALRGAAP
jgi:hypothetical protein